MAKRATKGPKAEQIVRGSGNVFADLGYLDAEERQTKLRLALALNTILDERKLNQADAAARLGVNQPKVLALRNYKLDGFSVERLMTLLTALDRDVEILIRKKPRSRGRRGSYFRGSLMLTVYIGNTDHNWFDFRLGESVLAEVNFLAASAKRPFIAFSQGSFSLSGSRALAIRLAALEF